VGRVAGLRQIEICPRRNIWEGTVAETQQCHQLISRASLVGLQPRHAKSRELARLRPANDFLAVYGVE